MRTMVRNKRSNLLLPLFAALVAGTLVAMPAIAQQKVDGEASNTVVMDKFVLDQLYARLERLERDMSGLVRTGKVPAGGGNYPDTTQNTAVAALNIKVSQLEEELASVTGELEEARHRVDRLASQQELAQKDTEYRLTALEKGRTNPGASLKADLDAEAEIAAESDEEQESEGKAASGKASKSDPTVAAGGLPAGDPAEKYNYAIGLLRQGAYEDAESAFRAFLDEHPDDDLASNASYWLGETYYVRDQHKEAASAFLSGLKAYPKGNKAAQSMLKLGITLLQLGHKEQGCVTLGEIGERFPNAPDKVDERAQQERKKAGCV